MSSAKLNNIKNGFQHYMANIAIPLFGNLAKSTSKVKMLDSIIKFFVGVGDILDINESGLKAELIKNPKYNETKDYIAKQQLRLRKKKRSLVQDHIRKVMLLNYGLNSVIIFRDIYRSTPGFHENMPINYNAMVESAERVSDKFLTGMLENLDKDWEKWTAPLRLDR